MPKQRQSSLKRGEVRIIGGVYRGRKIYFPEQIGLRPTPNRVRETLFNWLSPAIRGANCLDLFAGSGALGIEAISRGASSCVALDSSKEAIAALAVNKAALQMVNLNIIQAHFPYEPTLFKHPFDLVFIDPPFSQGYVSEALNWLVQSNLLKPDALVYIEIGRDQALQLPNDFTCFKDKVAGEVRYMLAQFTPPLSS